jgi:hypothetical protein
LTLLSALSYIDRNALAVLALPLFARPVSAPSNTGSSSLASPSRTRWGYGTDTGSHRLEGGREKEHPEDAAPIYLKQAEVAIAATSNGRYEDSVGLLVKAAAVMRGSTATRSSYVT